jgi:hypothetical protein
MNLRLRALTLGACISLTLTGPVRAVPPATPRATPSPPPIVAELPAAEAASLYSPHAQRLIRSYLRLRLLELREQELDRARSVIEGRLGVDDLLKK